MESVDGGENEEGRVWRVWRVWMEGRVWRGECGGWESVEVGRVWNGARHKHGENSLGTHSIQNGSRDELSHGVESHELEHTEGGHQSTSPLPRGEVGWGRGGERRGRKERGETGGERRGRMERGEEGWGEERRDGERTLLRCVVTVIYKDDNTSPQPPS